MEIVKISIDNLREYVYCSLIDDVEIIDFFDKNVPVKNTIDVIDGIVYKVKNAYEDAEIFGAELDKEKVGFFVCKDPLLISFGLTPKHRNKEVLSQFWQSITTILPTNFQCVLYSHNERAINFLKKCGMKILFDEITILTTN